jgi:hypothetical protein
MMTLMSDTLTLIVIALLGIGMLAVAFTLPGTQLLLSFLGGFAFGHGGVGLLINSLGRRR